MALLLLLSFSTNARGESTIASSPTVVTNTTKKSIETASTDSTIALETTTVSEPETTKSLDNQTIEIITMNASKIQTTKSPKLNSTNNSTMNFLDALMDVKPITNHVKSHDVKNYFPHPDKPEWAHIEQSKRMFGN